MYPTDATKYARSYPAIECVQCGEWLFVPERSEHVNDRRVRHVWNCEPCGYSFETTVIFRAVTRA